MYGKSRFPSSVKGFSPEGLTRISRSDEIRTWKQSNLPLRLLRLFPRPPVKETFSGTVFGYATRVLEIRTA